MPPVTLDGASCSVPMAANDPMSPATVPKSPNKGARVIMVLMHPHAGLGFLDELGGVQLHGGQHGGVRVAHAFAEIGEVWLGRVFPDFPGGREIAGAEGLAGFFLMAGAMFAWSAATRRRGRA